MRSYTTALVEVFLAPDGHSAERTSRALGGLLGCRPLGRRCMLRDSIAAAFLIAALALIAGCGNGVGNDGALVGGSCLVSSDCAMSSRCLSGPSFPGGYCATTCDVQADCPGGSTCIEDTVLGGTC